MAVDLAEFEPILQEFLAADNAIRNAAEARLVEMKKHPDTLVLSLLNAVQHSATPVYRTTGAVLIRRVLAQDNPSLWFAMSAECQRTVQAALLECLGPGFEADRSIAAKIVHTVSELGVLTLEDGNWPDLMPTISGMIHSESPETRVNALRLFEELSYSIASCMEEQFADFIAVFHGLLSDPSAPALVRLGAMRASAALCIYTEKPSLRPMFSPLVPLYLNNVLGPAIEAGDMSASKECLSLMIDMADDASMAFKEHLRDTLDTVLHVANSEAVPNALRHLAIEFVCALTEKVPYLMRKLPDNHFLMATLPVVFGFMVDLDEDPTWENKDDDDEERELKNVAVGEEVMDRLADAIGSKKFMPIVMLMIQENLSPENDWKLQYAALMALSNTLDVMEGSEEQIVGVTEMVLPWTTEDKHVRVRYAAIHALGMLAYGQSPTFQIECAEVVLPVLRDALANTSSNRCQGHAAEAVSNFADMCPKELLEPHLEGLLGACFDILRSDANNNATRTSALNAITALADQVKESVEPFYDHFVPLLYDVISRCFGDPTLREMRGRAIECITTVGSAVGPERFRADAIRIMEALLKEHASIEADDPQRVFMWQAFSRIATVLGEDFAPYLEIVMPSLLEAVQDMSAAVPVDEDETSDRKFERRGPAGAGFGEGGDDDDDDDGADDDDDDEEGPMVEGRAGGKRFKVKSAVLEDKAQAVAMLGLFAQGLKDGFWPYCDQTAKALLPMLEIDGPAYDTLRSNALTVLPSLIRCARLTVGLAALRGHEAPVDTSYVMDLAWTVLDTCLKVLFTESDMDNIMTIVQTVKLGVECYAQVPTLPVAEAAAAAAGGGGGAAGAGGGAVVPALPSDGVGPTTSSGEAVEDGSIAGDRRALLRAAATGSSIEPSKYEPVLTAEQLTRCIKDLQMCVQKSFQRRAVRVAEAKVYAEDIDEEEDHRMYVKGEREAELQFYCFDALGTLVKTHPEGFVGLFGEHLWERVATMAHPECTANDRKLAVFMLDDMLEHAGDLCAAAGMLGDFVPILCGYCGDEDPEVAQASVYGVGAAASSVNPAAFGPFVAQCAEALSAVISRPGALKGHAASVHDNAVSALGKILMCQGDNMDVAAAAPFWLGNMPLTKDYDESRVATQQLCSFVASGNTAVLGPALENLPRILEVLAGVVQLEKIATEALAARVVSILRGLHAALSGDVIGAVWAALPAEARDVLHRLNGDKKFAEVPAAEVAIGGAKAAAA